MIVGRTDLGLTDQGGGLPASLTIQGIANGSNVLAYDYGKSNVHDIRDELHDTRYNVVHSGYNDIKGRPIQILAMASQSGSGQRLYVEPFSSSLWCSDSKYDYTQYEDLVADSYGDDGGNSDADELPEIGKSMIDEVQSEWDFAEYYEDATSLISVPNVDVIRHYYYYEYKRPAEAIRQWHAGIVMLDGQPAINPANRISDISPIHYPGLQTATDIDMSLQHMTYSLRLFNTDNQGYRYGLYMSQNSGEWVSKDLARGEPTLNIRSFGPQYTDIVPPEQFTSNGCFAITDSVENDGVKDNLIVAARSTDPDAPGAVGLWHWEGSGVNAHCALGIQNRKVIYTEDRRIQSKFAFSCPASKQKTFGKFHGRSMITGMLAPDNLPAGVTEACQSEQFYLVGTPNAIWDAVQQLKVHADVVNTVHHYNFSASSAR
ncbi:MAG: hypothetical protein NTW86_02065 [Candidatus Sumerlaeota bacterium]|nr:hypothetical protein [Candidatus Sumerlaeota bacterium]